ncbi:MAG: ribosome biogenesis GTPase YqeH [Bacilli bacterium]|jgi:ribosome biogenesis GTPase YqeH|nr:ribosome biogenesis GTPase YqeH [Bacilli bacterium]HHU23971.1 ribosome biogenesis GTPase YqeH [Acholeplasmataceae bacterium]
MSRCIGCGIKLQTADETAPGFVSELVLIEKGEMAYCKRCFSLRHYNQELFSGSLQSFNEQYYLKLQTVKESDCLVVLILDVLDLNGGFIPRLKEYVQNKKVLILINKIDLLPLSIKVHHIERYIRQKANTLNLNLAQILPISALKTKDLIKALTKIEHYVNQKKNLNHDVFVLGATSVGKSTIMNGFIRLLQMEKYPSDLITTSNRPQTTLDIIKIPFAKGVTKKYRYLIDTPGYLHPNSIASYLSFDSIKMIAPKNKIKVRTFQLKGKQTLFLGGLARIDLDSTQASVSCFVANSLYVHRTKTEGANTFYQEHLGELLVPPLSAEEKAWASKVKQHQFALEENLFYDLTISGLGFLHIKGQNLKITVTVPESTLVECPVSFITGEPE